jgi:hypothetical protein
MVRKADNLIAKCGILFISQPVSLDAFTSVTVQIDRTLDVATNYEHFLQYNDIMFMPPLQR